MSPRTALTVLLLSLALGSAQAAPAARRLSLEDRLAAVEAIERVFWSHRTWPEQNPGPKPAFEDVFSRAALRVKVEDSLRLSSAVERLWDRPITRAQLQAELDRIVAGTKQPAVLREIFAALGDDPQLIAECVARPILAERIARSSYARDVRFHEAVRRAAEAAAAVARTPADLKRLGGEYFEQTRGSEADDAVARPGAVRTVAMDEAAWHATRRRLAARFRAPGAPASHDEPLPIGRVSRLREDDDTFSLLTVLSDSGASVTTATVVWRKTPFEGWWKSARSEFGYDVEAPAGPYSLGSPEDGCTDGTWSAMRYEVPDPRVGHTAVWTGTEMIVWGGEDDFVVETGGRYNPATDSWTLTSMTNVPFSRSRHTAVWTGTEMIVWGGFHPYVSLADGGRYNPATDQWTPTSTGANVPTGRQDHTAVWTGTEMIVWGGINETTFERFNTGGRYNPATDSWAATTTTAAPPGRDLHTAVWTGSVMIVFGGNNASLQYLTAGSRYNPATNSWSAIPAIPSSGRARHTAVWSDTEMIVFGGYNGVSYLNSGGRYNPATNSWALTNVGAGVPTGRAYHVAVWTGSQMVVHGGYDGSNYLASGGRYSPATDTWLPTSTLGAEAPRALQRAVWNGTEMLVWGGYNTYDYIVRGGRYDPATDNWALMSGGSTMPSARYSHKAVWTGSEMLVMGGWNEYYTPDSWRYVPATDTWAPAGLGTGDRYAHLAIWTGREAIVWGGYDQVGALATGARFDPTASTWTPTSQGPDRPAARGDLAGVWDGSRLVLWGGWDGSAALASGGRYDPKTDAWAPISSTDAPSPRAAHVAVWTGKEMVAWGGTPDGTAALSTGGRYRPSTDSWEPTSTTDAPVGRWFHEAVWTGSRMVLQGGYNGVTRLGTASRYDPAGDVWYPATDFGSLREGHTMVWTGSDVLLWGGHNGSSYLASGTRYDPATDAFSSIPFGGLSARAYHSAVWTGERMVVWGGVLSTSTGSAYCSVPSCPVVAWFRDADGDAFGNGTDTVLSCVQPLGYVTAAGDCDDASAAANPSASEACDGLDNDCDAVVDDVARPGAVASVVSLRSGEAVTISWDAVAGAQTYDVVRGLLGLLGSTGGDFSSSVSGCLGNDLPGTSIVDPDAPEAGNGFWHLVRGANCGGSGTYDEASPGQAGTRDAEILAAPGACP